MYVFVFGYNIPIPELLLIVLAVLVVFAIALYFAYRKAEHVVETQSEQITDLSDSIEDLAEQLQNLSGDLGNRYCIPNPHTMISKIPLKPKTEVPREVLQIHEEIGESLSAVKKIKKKPLRTKPRLSEAELKKLEDRLKKNISSVNKILDKTSERVQTEVQRG